MKKFIPIPIVFSCVALFVVFTSLLLNNTSLASTTPQVSAGSSHSLALKSDGTVWAWGANWNSQLGDGTTTDKKTPVQVSGLSGIIAVDAGKYHGLALKSDGTVWAWGWNKYGQLGDGTTTNRSTPIQVDGLSDITSITAGYYHSLALKSDGTVYVWGFNGEGELGDGTTTNSSIPIKLSSLSGVIAIAAGYYHNLALKSDGTIWAWGGVGYIQLGDGNSGGSYTPVQVVDINNATGIAAGGYHSLALRSDATVWAWGGNWNGQLGDETNEVRNTPVQVSNLSDIIAIDTFREHSLALKSDGTVWSWGFNWNGQVGDGTSNNKRVYPVQVNNISSITAIAAGEWYSLALKSDGTAWSWGYNDSGQLGDGTTDEKYVPVQVKNLNLGQTTTSTPTPTVTASPTPTPSSTTTPPTSWVTNPSNGHRYKLTYRGTWEECESDAVYEGAHLVTINDEDEQNWLIATFGGDEPYYIGFTDKNKERVWEWISGEEVTYTNWSDGEPNNCGGDNCEDEDYAEMNNESPGKWNDVPGSSQLRAIMEKSGQTVMPSPTPKATPTPTPAEGTGVIYGFVMDENEFAFKNVSVTLTDTNGYSKNAKTDKEGYYEFVNLAAGDYTLTYSKDGYQTQTQDISLEEDESLDIGAITMEPVEKGMISGYVVDIRGDPIEYAKLKLKGIKIKKTTTAVSDADGFFEFTGLDADDYIITAKKSRYKSTRKTIQLEEGDEVEVEIEMKKTSRRGVMVLDP